MHVDFSTPFTKKRAVGKASIPILSAMDDPIALRAVRRRKGRRMDKFFEVVFVRAVPYIILGIKIVATRFACLPISFMLLNTMVSAQGVPPVVARATVSGE